VIVKVERVGGRRRLVQLMIGSPAMRFELTKEEARKLAHGLRKATAAIEYSELTSRIGAAFRRLEKKHGGVQ